MSAMPAPTAGRCSLGIAAGLLLATLASVVRAALAGRLDHLTELLPLAEALVQLAFFGGVGLAGACYLRALRFVSGPLTKRLVGQALVIHLCVAPALPLTSNDLFSGLAYGRLLERGENPYRVGPEALPTDDVFRARVDPEWAAVPSRYGPLALLVGRLAVAAGGVGSAVLAFKLLMALAGFAAVGLAALVCRATGGASDGDARAFVLVAWNPLLAWEVTGQAHVDGLVVVAALGFLHFAFRGHERSAAGCLAAAVLAKAILLPLLGLYLWHLLRNAPRSFAGASGVVALLLTLSIAPFGLWPVLTALPFAPEQLVNSLAAVGRFLVRALAGETAARAMATAWSMLALFGLAALAARAAWRTRTLTAAVHESLVFLLLAQAVAMGWFMVWYPVVLLPLALFADDELKHAVAVYTVLVPALYLPWDGAGVPILLAHGLAAKHALRALRLRPLESAGPWS